MLLYEVAHTFDHIFLYACNTKGCPSCLSQHFLNIFRRIIVRLHLVSTLSLHLRSILYPRTSLHLIIFALNCNYFIFSLKKTIKLMILLLFFIELLLFLSTAFIPFNNLYFFRNLWSMIVANVDYMSIVALFYNFIVAQLL